MRGVTRTVLAACMLAVVGAGCGSSGGGAGDGDFNVGGLFAASGPNEAVEKPFEEGARLAISEQPDLVDIEYYDTAADPAKAVQQFQAAYSRDSTRLFLGAIFTPSALAVADQAKNRDDALYFASGSTAPALSEPAHPRVFAVNPGTALQVTTMLDLAESMDAKRIGVIYETDAFGEDVNSAVEDQIEDHGMTVAKTVTIATDATDASSQVAEMRSADVDAIVLGTIVGPTTAVLKEAQSVGVDTPFLINQSGLAEAVVAQALRGDRTNVFIASPLACPLHPSLIGDCVKEFADKYEAEYGSVPDVYNAIGYAGTQAFLDAVKQAESSSAEDVAAALEENEPVQTVMGELDWSEGKHLGASALKMQGISDGRISFFGTDVDENDLDR